MYELFWGLIVNSGAVVFCVIAIVEAGDAQPFVPVPNTLSVEAEDAVITLLLPKPPLHVYVLAPLTFNIIELSVQFKTDDPVVLIMVKVGAVVFCEILITVELVHPEVPVAVAIYCPGAVIVTFDAGGKPPLQTYDVPPLMLSEILGVLQVSCTDPVLFVSITVGTPAL